MTFSNSPSPGVALQGGGGSGGGGGGTPGGSSGQVQYNNAGSFGGMSGTAWSDTNRALTITGATLTADAPILDLTQTWNNAAVTFTGIKLNATSTASAAASLLMDLQLAGTSVLKVNKSGMTSVFTGMANAGVSTVILSGVSGTNDSRGGASLYSSFPTGADTTPRRIADIYAGLGDATWNNAYINFGVSAAANDVANINPTSFQITRFGACVLNQLSFASTLASPATGDLILRRRTTANLQLGAADAAAPAPQFLSVQSVVAGTSNTAGAAFTIAGSQGTGTGAGGSLIFQVAPAGSSGSAQNALAAALTIDSTSRATFGSVIRTPSVAAIGGSAASSTMSIGSANGNGIYFSTNSWVGVQVDNGGFYTFATTGFVVNSAASIGFSSGLYPGFAALNQDVSLFRDAADILALRRTTNAQEFRVYETTTGTIYKAILGNRGLMKISGAAFADGAGAQAGTLTNAPAVGNPTKWISIDDNGTTRYIPAW